jgi:hypothetical protein
VQHPAQLGMAQLDVITIAPQLRGCWPDLIFDSNERTPAATLAGFFLAHGRLFWTQNSSGAPASQTAE